jgi:hypothetical protein
MKSANIIIIVLLIMSVFFSGCVSVDINQKMYRDESIDFSIKFSSESAYVMAMLKEEYILNMLKHEIAKTEDFDSEWIYTEDFNSFIFSIEHLDISKNSDNAATEGLIFKPEMTKEFKFPYYYYTYSFVEKDILSTDLLAGYNFNEIIYVDYNVEVFGNVVDTNGLKTSKNSVIFKMSTDPNQDKRNYVTFKDIFIRTWLKI